MSKHPPIALGVNLDHVATLRQARGTRYPDPVDAALCAEKAGADSITLHLREDRRHIQDDDVFRLVEVMSTHLNFEMAISGEMLAIAAKLQPSDCCLVPENRQELTTEGGLDVVSNLDRVAEACRRLEGSGIRVSLFIDPDARQLDAAVQVGAPVVELHTGAYAEWSGSAQAEELQRIKAAAEYGASLGLIVNAGHGLHNENVAAIAALPDIAELNIGHAIVSRAVFVGLEQAIQEIRQRMLDARSSPQ